MAHGWRNDAVYEASDGLKKKRVSTICNISTVWGGGRYAVPVLKYGNGYACRLGLRPPAPLASS